MRCLNVTITLIWRQMSLFESMRGCIIVSFQNCSSYMHVLVRGGLWGISLKMHVEGVVDDLCLWRMSLV